MQAIICVHVTSKIDSSDLTKIRIISYALYASNITKTQYYYAAYDGLYIFFVFINDTKIAIHVFQILVQLKHST